MSEPMSAESKRWVPDYASVSEVQPIPILERWRDIGPEEFRRVHAHRPAILPGLGADSRAFRTWDREFLKRFRREPVTVKSRVQISGKEQKAVLYTDVATMLGMLDGPEPVQVSEWYLFRRHPELLDDLTHVFPPYLLDDWLELFPRGWIFNSGSRTSIYLGTDGTSTSCHVDGWNTVTWAATLRGTKRWLTFSTRGPGFRGRGPAALRAARMMRDGLVTVADLQGYFFLRPDALPDLEFFAGDVPAGSAIYVPWGWAHQVHNLGFSLAVSRYYASEENYHAFREALLETNGRLAGELFRVLAGSARRRRVWRLESARAALESSAARALFRTALVASAHLNGIPGAQPFGVMLSHHTIPDEQGPSSER
jgi:hypothetical protein